MVRYLLLQAGLHFTVFYDGVDNLPVSSFCVDYNHHLSRYGRPSLDSVISPSASNSSLVTILEGSFHRAISSIYLCIEVELTLTDVERNSVLKGSW